MNITKNKSIIVKQIEILFWDLFSERFNNKILKLKFKDKTFADKITKIQIYTKMKLYFTNISDRYLYIITCKVKKINKLFRFEYNSVTLKKINDIG